MDQQVIWIFLDLLDDICNIFFMRASLSSKATFLISSRDIILHVPEGAQSVEADNKTDNSFQQKISNENRNVLAGASSNRSFLMITINNEC